MITVYMVVVYKESDNPDQEYYKRIRNWGFYTDLAVARNAIIQNWTDMYELGYYDRAVIESVEEGIMGNTEFVEWFKADYGDWRGPERDESGRWIPTPDPVVTTVERPEWSKGLCGLWPA